MLIPFTVEAEITALGLGKAYIGFSVDEPLPERFSEIPGKTVGIIDIVVIGVGVKFGPTTVNINVEAGNHYVILGIQLPVISISGCSLKLSGAGAKASTSFNAIESLKYVYIAFNVDKNGVVKIINYGEIAPGGAPIVNPGGGSIFEGDVSNAITLVMGNLIQMMLPLAIMSMMLNLMTGLIQGMTMVIR
ncbi:MAG: hypothetical protein RMI45_08685 [Ignisphaera sp.]|nr:hypothetical protein [Ignisphaera sp.]